MAFNYNYITNRTSPNQTAGRGGSGIKGVVIHWWGLPKDANPDGVVNWLCNPNAQVSAHIVTTGTGRRVWQLVADTNTAWHAGTWNANISTIGIEADPRCRDEDYDVLAEVIANLWKYYGKLPLYRHSDFIATQCPGNYDLNRLRALAEEKLNPKPKPAPKPVKQPVPNAIKLPVPVYFKAKLDNVSVWDLETNPNYKATTTLKKGNEFRAYAQIKFNNSTYYVTEYSYGNGNKHGVNSVDLEPVIAQPTPKPTPAPTPAPKPVETPTSAPEPIVVQPTPEEIKQQEEATRRFREEMERLSKENNTLLKSIQSLVQWIVDKLKAVFK